MFFSEGYQKKNSIKQKVYVFFSRKLAIIANDKSLLTLMGLITQPKRLPLQALQCIRFIQANLQGENYG